MLRSSDKTFVPSSAKANASGVPAPASGAAGSSPGVLRAEDGVSGIVIIIIFVFGPFLVELAGRRAFQDAYEDGPDLEASRSFRSLSIIFTGFHLPGRKAQ